MPSNKTKRYSCSLPCIFCGSKENDEFLYGKLFHFQNLSVHQNCLFFASALGQNGRKETDGILGFLIRDIKNEVLRGKKLKCCYCRTTGATVGCCDNRCKKSFHLCCGIKAKSLHQFFDHFASYCELHKPRQTKVDICEELRCFICLQSLSESVLDDCLYAPCCKKNWFHRSCLQKYALSAGVHFFKCPLCNNSKDFIKEMLFYGINIPEKDASWELEENAYQDLLQRPGCGEVSCTCVQGRKHNGKGKWSLLICSCCGSNAKHTACAGLSRKPQYLWKCDDCKEMEQKIKVNKRSALENSNHCKQLDATPESSKHVEKIGTSFAISGQIQPAPSKNNEHDKQLELAFPHFKKEPTEPRSEPSCSSEHLTSTSLKSITNTYNSPMKRAILDKTPYKCLVKVTRLDMELALKGVAQPIYTSSTQQIKRKATVPPTDVVNKKVCIEETSVSQIKVEPSENPYAQIFAKGNSMKTVSVCQRPKTKVKKKAKITDSECCSTHLGHMCIKKMFGLQCRNRI